MKKSTGTIACLLLASFFYLVRPGCELGDIDSVSVGDYFPPVATPGAAGSDGGVQPTGPAQQTGTGYLPGTIILGSFNIQVFGVAKSSKPQVMATLVDVARRYDLLAIQELRSNEQSVIANFVRNINSDGSAYSFIIGPRQGYTSSKEQYVYIFDTTKFRLTSDPYVARDVTNSMHRPPLVASFECVQAPPGHGFTFTVLNLHVDPDVVDQEFLALENIISTVTASHPNEDDFIVMGDFNDSEKGIRKFGWLQNQLPLIRSTWSTKIRSRRSIDNIVIDGVRTAEYRNQSGVLDLRQQYQLNQQQALQVSDHFPVWAVFTTLESQSRFVNNSSQATFSQR